MVGRYGHGMSHSSQVREFHRAADGPVPDRPTVPDLELLDLRARLIAEESAEVADEFDRLRRRVAALSTVEPPDLAALAHELVDLLYVAYGALDAFGLPTDAIFDAVHAANLAKTTGNRVVDENGKLGKPEGWQPADVVAIVAAAYGDS